MAGQQASVVKQPALPRWLKFANRVIVFLQRLGLAIGTMHVLTVMGRKSGKPHSTPVQIVTIAGQTYIVAGLEKADWVRNARAAGWGYFAHGRKRRRVGLVEVPVEQCGAILREFPRQVPHGVAFFTQIHGVGPDPDAFSALASVCPVFRVED